MLTVAVPPVVVAVPPVLVALRHSVLVVPVCTHTWACACATSGCMHTAGCATVLPRRLCVGTAQRPDVAWLLTAVHCAQQCVYVCTQCVLMYRSGIGGYVAVALAVPRRHPQLSSCAFLHATRVGATNMQRLKLVKM